MALSGGGFGTGRRLAGAAEGLGTAVVVIALVAAAVFAATRPALRWRLDLTEGEQYTLTDQTLAVLDNLEAPVTITTLFRPEPQVVPNGLFDVQQRAAEYVRNLLREYDVRAGGQLTVRHLSPQTDRAEADTLVRQFNLARYNVVLLQSGERTQQVYLEDLATIDRGLSDPENLQMAELRELHGERPLTSALLSLASAALPRAGFLVGQGEPRIDDFDVAGLGLLAQALRGQGLELSQVDLSRGGGLTELDVLAIIGPQRRLTRDAVAAVKSFHEAGGALLVAVDPWVPDSELDALLADDLGLLRERAILTLDNPHFEDARRAVIPLREFYDHPISAPIASQGLVAVLAPGGGIARHPEAPVTLGTYPLARTPPGAFGDLPGADGQQGDYILGGDELQAPRNVGFAVEGGPARAVVFGGGGFLENSFLDATEGGPGNMDLALNAFNWLVERDYAVAARPREVFESRVELYDEERGTVFLYVAVLMPLGGALIGLAVWFIRRR